jgi:hypothetical protein
MSKLFARRYSVSPSIILLAPTKPLAGVPASAPSYSRFADELRRYSAWRAELRAESSTSDDGASFLLVFGYEPPEWILSMTPEVRQQTLERVVLIRCARAPSVLDDLEQWGVAAAIETLTYSLWESPRNGTTGYGIAGLREAVASIGGECAAEPFASEHYCVYGSVKSSTLTQALAEYLKALAILRS